MRGRVGGAAYHRDITSDHAAPEGRALPIRLFLADVDGTLVTQDKVLTHAAVAAVRSLRQAGVLFAITSGRPPRGMEMLVQPLDLDTPIAAFNGGLLVDRAMQVLEQHVIPEDLVVPVADHMKSFKLDVWLYRGADWFVSDPKAPHVDREAWTVKFEPKVMDGLRRAHRRRRQAGRGERRPRRHRRGGPRRHREVRRPRDGGGLPALLPRRDAPPGQQGSRRPLPGLALQARSRGDRHHRRPAQRHSDVRPFGAEHRDGQRRPRGEAGGPAHLAEQRGRGFRVRRRALRAAGGRRPARFRGSQIPSRRRGGSRSARTASRTTGWPSRSGRCGAWPLRSARRRPGRWAPRRCTRTRGR